MGCACGSANSSSVGERAERLVGGQPSPLGTSDDAVVLVLVQDLGGNRLCTGTLVARRLVVTARHCIAQLNDAPFQCALSGELVPNTTGGGTIGSDFPVSEISIWGAGVPRTASLAGVTEILSTLTPTTCTNDIAFLVLEQELDLPVVPIRLGTPTHRGELVTLVGYGIEYPTQRIDWQTWERQRLAHQEIVAVGPDSPEQPVLTAPPRTIELRGPSVCFGDSGGPALSEGTRALVGVSSLFRATDCTTTDLVIYHTHVSAFESLALEAFEHAGADPWLEGEPNPLLGADVCVNSADCASGSICDSTDGVCVANDGGGNDGTCTLVHAPDPTESGIGWLGTGLAVVLALRRRSGRT
jgi:hypothetical protein